MILEPQDLDLLRRLLAARKTATSKPGAYDDARFYYRDVTFPAEREASALLQRLFQTAVDAIPHALQLPDGVEYIGARAGMSGTELWLNSAPVNEAGDRTTFCLPLSKLIRDTAAAQRAEFQPATT